MKTHWAIRDRCVSVCTESGQFKAVTQQPQRGGGPPPAAGGAPEIPQQLGETKPRPAGAFPLPAEPE